MKHRRNILSDLITKHDLKIGAETGVGSGPTTHYLLETHPELLWIGVDHFPAGFPLVDGTTMPQERQDKYRLNYAMLVELHAPRLTWIDAPVPEAASQVADGSLDLVFIDDDHSYEGCRDAILAWRPKVRIGGWLAGHDYYPERFPGVVKAVKELIPGFGVADDFVWLTKVTA
jgi:hypothetical protein